MRVIGKDLSTEERRRAIVEAIRAHAIASQSELMALLESQNSPVTQATLSRDLKALGIAKIPNPDGTYRYAIPTASSHVSQKDTRVQQVSDSHRTLEIEAFVLNVKVIGNLMLVRTTPGNANGVSRVLDEATWPEIEGTVAGDDTILVVCSNATKAKHCRDRLMAMRA